MYGKISIMMIIIMKLNSITPKTYKGTSPKAKDRVRVHLPNRIINIIIIEFRFEYKISQH